MLTVSLIPDRYAVSSAGDFAQTAAVVATEQGSSAVATLSALGTPDLDGLKEKIEAITPDLEGDFSFTISAQELNRLLALQQIIGNFSPTAPVKNASVEFTGGLILLEADVLDPLSARAEFIFRPIIEDGGLKFDSVEASVAGRDVPPDVLEAATGLLNGSLGEGFEHLPSGLKLRSVQVGNGALTVEGGEQS